MMKTENQWIFRDYSKAIDINILQIFGHSQLHVVTSECRNWNIEALYHDLKDCLIKSDVVDIRSTKTRPVFKWGRALFKVSPSLFIHINNSQSNHYNLEVYGADKQIAEDTYSVFKKKYLHRTKPGLSLNRDFFILKMEEGYISAQKASVTKAFPKTAEDLALHYGDDFMEWEERLLKKIRKTESGITILRGDPGTGKTSFLRRLIAKLGKKYPCYYLPLQQSECLTSPGMIQFWEDEQSDNGNQKRIVLLEDAEMLLMPRGSGNQENLSDLLNISDGLLGEFLQMHIICTINCEIDKLDPALTRSGRLLAQRHFRRLDYNEAAKLALAKGIKIPVQKDYSLAEIYNGISLIEGSLCEKRMGFG